MKDHSTHSSESVAILEKELRYISHLIKQKGREILSNYTITPPQFIALQWLHESGDMTIGDLSYKNVFSIFDNNRFSGPDGEK